VTAFSVCERKVKHSMATGKEEETRDTEGKDREAGSCLDMKKESREDFKFLISLTQWEEAPLPSKEHGRN
jgi:hypothetical protein